jgi:GT2 family glycosyltransferase
MISVIIPTFGRFESLKKAIQSVLQQTYRTFEVIVIDDASPDPEYANLSKVWSNQPEVKIIRLAKNQREVYGSKHAQGMTRMHGVAEAKGKYLAFLDDDDRFCEPEKLKLQVQLLNEYKEAKLCCSNCKRDQANLTFPQFHSGQLLKKTLFGDVFLLQSKDIHTTNYVLNSTVLVYKEIFLKAGGQTIEIYEDWNCWKRILKLGPAIYCHAPWTWYDTNHGQGSFYQYFANDVALTGFDRIQHVENEKSITDDECKRVRLLRLSSKSECKNTGPILYFPPQCNVRFTKDCKKLHTMLNQFWFLVETKKIPWTGLVLSELSSTQKIGECTSLMIPIPKPQNLSSCVYIQSSSSPPVSAKEVWFCIHPPMVSL